MKFRRHSVRLLAGYEDEARTGLARMPRWVRDSAALEPVTAGVPAATCALGDQPVKADQPASWPTRVVNAVRPGGAGRLALVGPHGEERHPVEPIFLPLAKMEMARLVCGRITRPRVAVDENARAKSELSSDAQVTARSRTRESIARALRRLAASPRSGRGCACRGRARGSRRTRARRSVVEP